MSEEIAPIIEEIKKALPEVDEEKIAGEMERYLKYGIVAQEAKKAILRKFGGTQQSYASMGERKLSELKGSEMNVDVLVKCLSSNERIQKTVNGEKTLVTGLVADETMIRRFVSWEGHLLEKGGIYSIKSPSHDPEVRFMGGTPSGERWHILHQRCFRKDIQGGGRDKPWSIHQGGGCTR
jgi:hypothetical protein